MARCCPVPGCQILIASAAPMCTKHWERVPRDIRGLLEQRNERHVEYLWRSAIAEAAKEPHKNMGRTGSLYPPGPHLA